MGRKVYLHSLDVYRLASVVGLDWQDFAVSHPSADGGFLADTDLGRMTHRVRLRQAYEGQCLLAVGTPEGTLRCGVNSLRPSACRIYPYHVQLSAQQPYTVALGNDAACPSFGTRWFQAQVDALGDDVDAAVADAALGARVEARWNELVEASSSPTPATIPLPAFLRWAWELHRQLGLPPPGDRGAWQLAAYRSIGEATLALLPVGAAAS